MRRGLLDDIPDRRVTMKQIVNTDHEQVVLLRFPFHECKTRRSMMHSYQCAVTLMFELVPEGRHLAVMGRFARKLVKAMNKIKDSKE